MLRGWIIRRPPAREGRTSTRPADQGRLERRPPAREGRTPGARSSRGMGTSPSPRAKAKRKNLPVCSPPCCVYHAGREGRGGQGRGERGRLVRAGPPAMRPAGRLGFRTDGAACGFAGWGALRACLWWPVPGATVYAEDGGTVDVMVSVVGGVLRDGGGVPALPWFAHRAGQGLARCAGIAAGEAVCAAGPAVTLGAQPRRAAQVRPDQVRPDPGRVGKGGVGEGGAGQGRACPVAGGPVPASEW